MASEFFIYSKTEKQYKDNKSSYSPNNIAFIEETEKVILPYAEFLFVPTKSGKAGEVLVKSNTGGAIFTDINSIIPTYTKGEIDGLIAEIKESNTPITESTVSGWGFTKNAGTVTSIKMAVPTGLIVNPSTAITSTGTFTISYATGYSIPTTTKQTSWDNKQNAITDLEDIRSGAENGDVAYGWGDHSKAGYLTAANVSPSSNTLSWGTSTTIATIGGKTITAKLPANPNTDTKVTSAANHYDPTGTKTISAANGASTDLSQTLGEQVVTGVTVDDKGHVTAVTSKSVYSPNDDTKVMAWAISTSSSDTYYPVAHATSDASIAMGFKTSSVYFKGNGELHARSLTLADNVNVMNELDQLNLNYQTLQQTCGQIAGMIPECENVIIVNATVTTSSSTATASPTPSNISNIATPLYLNLPLEDALNLWDWTNNENNKVCKLRFKILSSGIMEEILTCSISGTRIIWNYELAAGNTMYRCYITLPSTRPSSGVAIAQLITRIPVTYASYTTGTGITFNRDSTSGSYSIKHSNVVTAGTDVGKNGNSLNWGSTFKVPYFSYDTEGHITASGTSSLQIPNLITNVTIPLIIGPDLLITVPVSNLNEIAEVTRSCEPSQLLFIFNIQETFYSTTNEDSIFTHPGKTFCGTCDNVVANVENNKFIYYTSIADKKIAIIVNNKNVKIELDTIQPNVIYNISKIPIDSNIAYGECYGQTTTLGLSGDLRLGQELHIFLTNNSNNGSKGDTIILLPTLLSATKVIKQDNLDSIVIPLDSVGEINLVCSCYYDNDGSCTCYYLKTNVYPVTIK